MLNRILNTTVIAKFSVITALIVTAFYCMGYLGHLGESHMLGVNLPVSSLKDYMPGGIHLLYQILQSLVLTVLHPMEALSALREEGVLHYPLLALLLPLSLWALNNHLTCRFAGHPSVAKLRPVLYGLFIVLLLLFAYFQTATLWQTLKYQNLLFPVSLENQEKHQKNFDSRYQEWLKNDAQTDVGERRAHKNFLRERILHKEMQADPTLEKKLHAWKIWKARSNLHKNAWLAALVLTIGFYAFGILLLYRYIGTLSESLLPKLHAVYGLLFSLVMTVQLGLLPVVQGIKLSEPRYAVVRAADEKLPALAGQRLLKLAEGNWLYLYAYQDLWRLHLIKSGKIEHLEIIGQDDVFAWLELVQ